MPRQLLWVDDTEGQILASSHSARQRQARIRSHVQSSQRNQASSFSSDEIAAPGEQNLQSPDVVKGVPVSSLRPSKSLGRLAFKVTKTNVTHNPKNAKNVGSRQSNPKDSISGKSILALTRSLPFLWHGLSSSERGSLAFFQLRTSQEWAGWEDQYFWNILALQVSQRSQAVARSLIAVSALHERIDALSSVERTRLQSLSYEQSSRATTALLARLEISYFEALVSCLIMICFHSLQNGQAPFMLLRSGMRLLAECDDPRRASREERRMVDLHIRPLFGRLLSRPCSMVDPCKAFALSVKRHRVRAMTLTTEKPLVPPTFSTPIEARDSLSDILNWLHDNLPSEGKSGMSVEYFLSELHGLRDAWQIALAEGHFPETAHSIRSRRLLKAASLVSMIIITMAYCVEETAYDRYRAEFAEILFLLEGSWPSGHSFGIDAGLFDMTAFVGSKCRDPHVRRHALRLLKSRDRLEGDRIATNPAIILETLIALEERDLEVQTSHDVPAQNRRKLVCGQQHIEQGRIDLSFISADGIQKEKCYVSLAGPNIAKASKKFNSGANVPDVIFGIGYAAYLEDSESMSYFRLDLDRFYFPIPKV